MEKDEDQRAPGTSERQEEFVIPVVDEELVAGTTPVKTGSVRVDKHVQKHTKRVEAPLLRENVDVRRVPVNRVVAEAPPVRREGDTIIVSVVEEELVITKQLVLKEEIHLLKHRTKEHFVKDVELTREHAEVHHLDSSGRVLDPAAKRTSKPARRRGLLD
uniref:DUF2382 domain-containing protein n=1 Tax=Solibacter usitatus (strain Ellin6076) TaxID=234267 RepID=Q01PI1_SOLUE